MQKKVKLYPFEKAALEEIKILIGKNLDEMPSIKQLCRKSGLNADKLKKGFKLLFGETPYDYHMALKIKEAIRLLQQTDKPVYEIAWLLGYHHSSSFCLEFRRRTGYRPGHYRSEDGK